jgi:demethylmenaquinone methyltransferase/2-methoxy-6-polyprenyl-1,4-benzoquinol methylase
MQSNFGFQRIPKKDKVKKVQNVFTRVATKYDLMNDCMSFGLHRKWKEIFLDQFDYLPNSKLLDLAGGTGDIAKKFIDRGGEKATVYDLNEAMLQAGKNKIKSEKAGKYKNIAWEHGSAEDITHNDNSFDYCSISFGLRNVTDTEKALSEALRVLKPGGKFLCLEFSQIENKVIKKAYDGYAFGLIPKIGKFVAADQKAYEYLVQSIHLFHKADKLANMMRRTGFYNVKYRQLLFGVVAIHTGYKV